jgi:hypothetical protein
MLVLYQDVYLSMQRQTERKYVLLVRSAKTIRLGSPRGDLDARLCPIARRSRHLRDGSLARTIDHAKPALFNDEAPLSPS